MERMPDAIARYLEDCQLERKLSADTLKAYRIDLDQFSRFTGGKWGDRDLLSGYVKQLNQRFSPRSVKRKVASVRAFYREQHRAGVLEDDPFQRLNLRIQSPQQVPRVIPGGLVQRLLQATYDAHAATGSRQALRDIVVLELLFCTGLRVSELCALTTGSFQLEEEQLRLMIDGKGRKERVLQITTPELLRLMAAYCRAFAPEIQAQGSLLYNRRGAAPLPPVGAADHLPVPGPGGPLCPYHPPHVPPHLRHRPAGRRGGYPVHPIAAGTQFHHHNPDIHPCLHPAAGASAGGTAPPGGDEFLPVNGG